MTKKPSRSGTPWTAADRERHGDRFIQVRFSGRVKPGDDMSDAGKLEAVTRDGEKPAEAIRRLVREAFARLNPP
jgi:hypothetical protein